MRYLIHVTAWLETRVINKLTRAYTCEWKIQIRQWKPQWPGHSYLATNSQEIPPPVCRETEQRPHTGEQRKKVSGAVLRTELIKTGGLSLRDKRERDRERKQRDSIVVASLCQSKDFQMLHVRWLINCCLLLKRLPGVTANSYREYCMLKRYHTSLSQESGLAGFSAGSHRERQGLLVPKGPVSEMGRPHPFTPKGLVTGQDIDLCLEFSGRGVCGCGFLKKSLQMISWPLKHQRLVCSHCLYIQES